MCSPSFTGGRIFTSFIELSDMTTQILDDPGTDDACRILARKRLGFLAKARIVPPSLFIQSATANIAAGNSFDPGMTYVASGGNCV